MAVRNPLEPAVQGNQLKKAVPVTPAAPAERAAEEAAAEALLGHRFTRIELLREALTHRSAAPGAEQRRRLQRTPRIRW